MTHYEMIYNVIHQCRADPIEYIRKKLFLDVDESITNAHWDEFHHAFIKPDVHLYTHYQQLKTYADQQLPLPRPSASTTKLNNKKVPNKKKRIVVLTAYHPNSSILYDSSQTLVYDEQTKSPIYLVSATFSDKSKTYPKVDLSLIDYYSQPFLISEHDLTLFMKCKKLHFTHDRANPWNIDLNIQRNIDIKLVSDGDQAHTIIAFFKQHNRSKQHPPEWILSTINHHHQQGSSSGSSSSGVIHPASLKETIKMKALARSMQNQLIIRDS